MTASKYSKERKAFGKQIGEFGLMKEKLAEMAMQIFAVESMIYRTAGNIEAAMHAASGSGNKTQNTMKVARGIRDRKFDRQSVRQRDAGFRGG